ncbi:N-acetylglucosamine-6-phosphate deacetylase [Pediococcus damnosus]|uniref:N-acetylglucosamine-6-phosphate deacetylase n=1 Tax=Pediococcus damnosus TaxID=51663 RepID=A0A0R2HJ27_9LACO|nr:N-acetylglucosamine-6-phosphate deacetylase [Pediococcus damnosus]AMV63544.1 N-acetylglucosamine-6-phosphate deacetylase [Pediococcus damnosus]AMV66517.1 N-acetylglucosamine-6-phosphate deacetylase [Pediococcus damnosus]AMV68822.1 N-acetylglucosamine-6-phosphate deacetylase [Pediococcus damnosus]KRN53011.1 N-acetylglucosamine-6-phosphate deacetylase [Pediococcus damnosus]PIO80608.1 N-acetylglucosamine-6-phosphate deacetylase [Pediococcus damnosus]
MSYYIHADKFFLDNTTENGGYLEITDDGKFGTYTSVKPTGKIVDYSGRYVSPGLVDTHIHGLLGHDVMDNDWDKIQEMSEGLLQAGVTSWLPTTLTASADQLDAVCQTIGANYRKATGAKIQGIYFEGPFFTVEHKGAQNPKYFGDPSVETFERWQKSAKGLIKKIAIAPERDGVVEFTKAVSRMGVSVALGHSDATFEQARDAVETGATVFTHTFNGMSGLNHRKPGMVGAAMSMHNVIDELICDGHHVLGEFPVYVADGMARLKDGGSLAGSILQLKEAVKNVVDWNISTPEQAVQMASKTAAVSSHIGDQCGSILPGRDADFLIWDHDMDLEETYLDGKSRYQA